MAEKALGWLGWSEDQTLASDVNAILIACEGKLDFFETIGFIKREKKPEKMPVMTPGVFKAVFG